MHVALITADYFPNIGGVAAHVHELASKLSERGNDVEVWLWTEEGNGLAEEAGGVPVISLAGGARGSRGRAPALAASIGSRMRALARRRRPDVMHVHTMAPLSLAMRLVAPRNGQARVFTNHTSGFLDLIETKYGRAKARLYCGGFDGIIAPSRELLNASHWASNRRTVTRYIPNGVDVARFSPGDRASARRRLGIAQSAVVVLATRRFETKNGVRYLASAIPALVDAHPETLVVMCGDDFGDGELQAVRNIVSTNRLDAFVRFEGKVPNSIIPVYLHAADVVVIPSLREATSISGLEAMAAQRRVVASAVGGLPEIVADGETGVLVPPASAEALAAGILRCLTYSEEELGGAARQKVLDGFTWDSVAAATEAYYREIIGLRNRRAKT